MDRTTKDLMEAFAGESQANRKYLAFAAKAEQEGYPYVARLFRAAAEAETIHAHAHLRALKGVKSTKENLEAAISGEFHEFKEMYPGMIAAAKDSGNKDAERSFAFANEVEKVHHALYEKALKSLEEKLKAVDMYICPVCGYTVENEPPDTCPVCGAKGKTFRKID
jgi:rubrerythrin